MAKKILSLFFSISFLFLLAVPSEAAGIKVGDYLQVGSYYGEPVLWRCIDIDENGPLMLSDKILCLKAFDASGTQESGSHARGDIDYSSSELTRGAFRQISGSSYWADSNLRCWLNSTEAAGDVNWLCGNPPDADHVTWNPYASEAGFLNGFTEAERNIICSVKQKFIISLKEYEVTPPSTYIGHLESFSLTQCLQNYDEAYGEECFDSMFLPSVKQLNSLYEKSDVLGSYYNAVPTTAAFEHTDYRSSKFTPGSPDQPWSFWLRDASSNRDTTVRRYNEGLVNYADAHIGINGVRPAFYLNQASLGMPEGSGTYEDPYVPKTVPLEISAYKKNGSVDVTVINTQEEVTGRLYIVGYAQNGRMTSVRSQSYTSSPGTDTVNILFPDNGEKIRVYYWSDIFQPLCTQSDWAQ